MSRNGPTYPNEGRRSLVCRAPQVHIASIEKRVRFEVLYEGTPSMGDLFAVADEQTAIVVDVRFKSELVPEAVFWRVPVMFRPSENWPNSVNEKLAGMCMGQSALRTEYSRDVMAPRCFSQTIEVQATTRAGAAMAAADAVLYATDRGLVPNWRVKIGDAILASPNKRPSRG